MDYNESTMMHATSSRGVRGDRSAGQSGKDDVFAVGTNLINEFGALIIYPLNSIFTCFGCYFPVKNLSIARIVHILKLDEKLLVRGNVETIWE